MSRYVVAQLIALVIGLVLIVLSYEFAGRTGGAIATVLVIPVWYGLAVYGQKREADLLRPAKRSLKCVSCGYLQDLGSESPCCPECGASVSSFVASVRQLRRDRQPPEQGSVFR